MRQEAIRYKAESPDASYFSSFQRVPQNVNKADAKVKEIARIAADYLAEITRKGQGN